MKHAFLRPTLLAAAVWLAAPLGLQAQTTGASAAHANTTATQGNPAVPAAATARDGLRAAPRAAQSPSASATTDRDFLRAAAGAGMYEVEVSRLATERATHAQVKAFAEKMVADHTDANQELAALAQARGVELPQQMPSNKRKVIERLKKSSNFDEDYVKTVGLKDHKADIALFDKAHRTSKDEELKTWAGEKLPTLQTHLKHAQEIYSQNMQKNGRTLPGIKTAPVMPEPSSLGSSGAPGAAITGTGTGTGAGNAR